LRQLFEATEHIRVVGMAAVDISLLLMGGMEAAIHALYNGGHYFNQNIAVVVDAYQDQNVCDD
jgi:hypothetical protein